MEANMSTVHVQGNTKTRITVHIIVFDSQ